MKRFCEFIHLSRLAALLLATALLAIVLSVGFRPASPKGPTPATAVLPVGFIARP